MALGLVLLLLLLALPLLGVGVDLLAARRARRQEAGNQGDGDRDMSARLQSLHDDSYRATLSAVAPSFRTTTSTRRFCCRPDAVSFATTGYLGP